MFLAFDLLKLIFSAAMVADLPAEACTEIGTISFIMLYNILILKCENMERLSRDFSSSQSLEISRQYLLLRTVMLQNIVAGCP